jgi:hypothetical protein
MPQRQQEGRMERSVFALIGAIVMVAACSGPEDGSMLQSEFQVAIVDEPDGRVSLYSGHLIADALARSEDLESLSFMTAFLRVRVPRELVDAVPTDPPRAVFISLEQAYPGVEILMHEFDSTTLVNGRATRMENTTFIPADPWLTGRAQVLRDEATGVLVGGAHIMKYSGTVPLGSAEHIWGMTSCADQPGCPALRYENSDPCRWPLPLPASWTLEALMGGPDTLDALCGNNI